jgi:hypothetical protein
MDIATLTELQTPEDVVRRFTPLGLSMGGMLTAEAAAEFQQRVVASADLIQSIPDDTRASFERLRTLHRFGILCYDAFTAVSDLAPLVADQALRERFVELHAGAVVVVARDGGERALPFGSVGELVDRLKADKLRLRDWPKTTAFAGGFGQLLHWARSHDLLSGQRARHAEKLLLRRRNRLAHPDGHHLVTPVQSARDIHDLAEIINRLWGAHTPGGRLYPALVQREALALAYQEDGGSSVGLASSLDNHTALTSATILLVRGVLQDEGLFDYDAAFEDTRLPTDLLWGPGNYREAISWLDEHQPQPDAVDHLDRWFVIHGSGENADRPRTPNLFAGLPEFERAGTWSLVRADFPQDAFAHVRYDHQPFPGPCGECAVDGRSVGAWAEVMDALLKSRLEVMPVPVVSARMPGRWPT